MLRFKQADGSEYPDKKRFVFTEGFEILKNNTLSRDCLNYEDGAAKNIHYGDVLIKYGFSKNINDKDVPFINNGVDIKGTPLNDGDVILADTAEDTTAGKATEVYGIGNSTVVSGLHTIPCRPIDTYALGYLGYYMNSFAYRKQLLPLMQGTKVTSINRKNIEESVVEVHSFEEQQKIADCLSSVDAVIADYESQVENMQNQKKGVMQKLFSQEVRFNADDGSEYPEWKERNIYELITDIVDFRGRTPKKLGMEWETEETEHIALSALNVKMGFIDYSADPHYGSDKLYEKWMQGRELHKGQVLFTTEAPMGNVAQVPDNKPYILSQRTIAFITDDNLITEGFLCCLLGSPDVQKDLGNLSTGGTAKGISQKSLKYLDVVLPESLEEQQKITGCLTAFDEAIEDLQKTVAHWKNIKKGLLQQLFV